MFYAEDPRTEIQRYLRPGERLLWAAKPDRDHFCRLRWSMVGFGIPWTAITAAVSGGFIYGMFFAKGEGLPLILRPFILLFFVPFWAIGIFMLGGHKLLYRRGWARTAYGITDHNIIILQPMALQGVREIRLPLREIENIRVERYERNLGTVQFASSLVGWEGGRTSNSPTCPAFESINDVDRAIEIARVALQARESARTDKEE